MNCCCCCCCRGFKADSIDLHASIAETQQALNLFLNNHFEEAKRILQPRCEIFALFVHIFVSKYDVPHLFSCRSDKNMYHSLGYGTIMFLQAAMTFESVRFECFKCESDYWHHSIWSTSSLNVFRATSKQPSKSWRLHLLCAVPLARSSLSFRFGRQIMINILQVRTQLRFSYAVLQN